jgi:hypothetical protein
MRARSKGAERGASPAREDGDPAWGWRGAVACGAMAIALIGCVKAPHLRSGAAPEANREPTTFQVTHESATDSATVDFKTYALNALLVPLLDDDSPPRWADPSLSVDCDAAQVTVDGAPLDIGAPVREGSFTVQWHMKRCTPFDSYLEVSGDVELRVESSGAGYRAVVLPSPLHIDSPQSHGVLTEPFVRELSIPR